MGESHKDMQKVLGLIKQANAAPEQNKERNEEQDIKLVQMQTEINNLTDNLKKTSQKSGTLIQLGNEKCQKLETRMTKELESLQKQFSRSKFTMVDQIPDLVSDLKLCDRNVQLLIIELSKLQTSTQNELDRLSKELETPVLCTAV